MNSVDQIPREVSAVSEVSRRAQQNLELSIRCAPDAPHGLGQTRGSPSGSACELGDPGQRAPSLQAWFPPFHFELGIVLKIKAEVIYLQTVYLTFVPPTDGIFLT